MPDISMCRGEGCSKKKACYRYTAVPNKWGQSYANFEETCPKNNFREFWDNKKGRLDK